MHNGRWTSGRSPSIESRASDQALPSERSSRGGAHMDPADFGNFLAALRRWDDRAVQELVLLAEPKLSQVVRARIEAGGLHRLADTDDVCQSVFFRFLHHAH